MFKKVALAIALTTLSGLAACNTVKAPART